MNPSLDHLAVAAIILAALAYFLVPLLRKRGDGKACGSGCCAPTKIEKPLK